MDNLWAFCGSFRGAFVAYVLEPDIRLTFNYLIIIVLTNLILTLSQLIIELMSGVSFYPKNDRLVDT